MALEGTIKSADNNKPIPATIKVTNQKTKEQLAEINNDSLTGKYKIFLKEGEKYDISIAAKGKKTTIASHQNNKPKLERTRQNIK